MVPTDFDETITFRRMRTWHALAEGDSSGDPVLHDGDLPTVPPRDEAGGRPLRSWHAYIDAGDFDALVALDPHVLEQIWRHTDGRLSYLIQRGLEALVEKLEQDAAYRPGSSAPRLRLATAPQAVDPVEPDEARAVIEALSRRDFARAIRTAERIAGEAAVPLRAAPPAAGPEDPEARRTVSEWLARHRGADHGAGGDR